LGSLEEGQFLYRTVCRVINVRHSKLDDNLTSVGIKPTLSAWKYKACWTVTNCWFRSNIELSTVERRL